MKTPIFIISCVSCPEVVLQLLQRVIKSPKQTKQIHSLLITSGYFVNESKELKLLTPLKWKSTFIFNTLIRSYLSMGQNRCVLILFNHMLAHKVHPNNLTFPSLIKAASASPSLASISGIALHSQALKRGVLWDPFVQTSFLRLYGEIGNLGSAHKMFDDIHHPCIVECNAMLDVFGRNGYMNSALRFFETMPQKDVVSWTSIINGFAKNGWFSKAIRLFAEMMGHVEVVAGKIKPNEATLVIMISCCANLPRGLYLGKQIHGYILRNMIILSAFLGTSLVDLYGKAGHVEMAIRVFKQTEAKEVCNWNAMISAFACHGREEQAIDMFKKMKVQRLCPNEVTFVAVLTACARANLVDLGMRLFQSMSCEYDVTPTSEHYGCVVDLLGRAGLLIEAINFTKSMPSEPDASVLGALLGACKIHGETRLGNEVGEKLLKLQPEHCGQYVALSNIKAVEKRWGHAAEFRKAMMEAGIRKIPAYSLLYNT